MLKKIYQELVAIRKELQAIRSGLKFFEKGSHITQTKEKVTVEVL